MNKFIALVTAVLLCSCGGKAGTSTAPAAEADNYVTEVTYGTPGTEEDFGISARIADGKVLVSIDADKFEHSIVGASMDYRLNESTYEVENTDASIVSILLSDIGQDYNPVLCMLREDGKVQIVDIFDAISRYGFFQASWPLPGLENIAEFKAKNYGDHAGIAAVTKDGKDTEVPYNTVGRQCDYVCQGFDTTDYTLTFTFTNDWKFACKHAITDDDGMVKEIKEYVGEYTSAPTGRDDDSKLVNYTIHTFCNVLADNATPKPFQENGSFVVEFVDDLHDMLAIIPQTGKILPLPVGEPARFDREEQ